MSETVTASVLTRRSFLVETFLLLAGGGARAGPVKDTGKPPAVLPALPRGWSMRAFAIGPDDETLAVGSSDGTGGVDIYVISLSRPDKFVLWCTIPDAHSIHSLSWSPGQSPEIAFVLRFLKGLGAETQIATAKKGEASMTRFVLSREQTRASVSGRHVALVWVSREEVCFWAAGDRAINKLNLNGGKPTEVYSPGPDDATLYIYEGMRRAGAGMIEFAQIDPELLQMTGNAKRPCLVQVPLADGRVRRLDLHPDSFGLCGPYFSDSSYVVGSIEDMSFDQTAKKVNVFYRPPRVYSRADNRMVRGLSDDQNYWFEPVAISASGKHVVCGRIGKASGAVDLVVLPLE